MTGRERERFRLLWHKTEHLLFRPSSESDQRKWCACFVSSLAPLWEVEPLGRGPTFPKATLSLPVAGFAIEYDLSGWAGNPQKACLRMTFEDVEVACQHMDHGFHDRMDLHNPPGGSLLAQYPDTASRRDELLADIRWVLDRYVVHPCAHLHPGPEMLTPWALADPVFRECLHEIRFGVGITNPFAALFQYRVNLVLRQTPRAIREAKEAERNRVASIVQDEILSGRTGQGVTAGKLFGRMG